MAGESIYWYDFETFGADPRRDRPAQFAGLRTDLNLCQLGDPLVQYCRPADDFLPHPDACLITGITPQKARELGVPEAEFIARINQEFAKPNTCVAGYNSIRFDDEVTRNTLYRNFFDPYAREWQNGNSRWDLIDVVRLTHALRPEGINWPSHQDGKPSFRLEDLTKANNLQHEAAHDALSDVHATIDIARLIKKHQPRLYDYVFQLRGKHEVGKLLDVVNKTPVLHVSAMYPAELGCIAMVAPLAVHPGNRNEIIVYDLRHDPQAFLHLSVDELQQRLFTRQDELPEGMARLPIKTIHINKSPVVVPLNTLTQEAAKRWQIDPQKGDDHVDRLRKSPQFIAALSEVYQQRSFAPETDPDLMLYSGGFFSNEDRQRMELIRHTVPEDLASLSLPFQDARIPEMLFRYRARNYPQSLSMEEKQRWDEFRLHRLIDSNAGGGICEAEFVSLIEERLKTEDIPQFQQEILRELLNYRSEIIPSHM